MNSALKKRMSKNDDVQLKVINQLQDSLVKKDAQQAQIKKELDEKYKNQMATLKKDLFSKTTEFVEIEDELEAVKG